jgi:hypothetical protein
MSARAKKVAANDAPDQIARMLVVPLTDGSVAYNVELKVGRTTVILAATDRQHAQSLVVELNECAWTDVA